MKLPNFFGKKPKTVQPAVVVNHPISNGSPKPPSQMQYAFVSIAAHELRTPLTSIRGYLQVLMSEYKDKMNEDQMDLLKNIEISANQLYALVENLLDVSRVERGSLNIKRESLDYGALVKEAVGEFKTRASQKNISLGIVPGSQIPKISVDRVRIKEVLSNLLNNAVLYTPANGRILIYVNQRGNDVVTSVVDNGPGITAEVIPHLFTQFYRALRSSDMQDPNPQGSGLGLFICKSIIDMHKGKIWVESQLGKGSAFIFSLPIYQA